MQIHQVRSLRRLLIALIAVVMLAVLVNYFQAWQRRRAAIQPTGQVLSPDLLRSADTIEYTAHEAGRTRFRIRAEKVLQTRQGKELLQGIEAIDFNPDGSERNRISSRAAEYDVGGKQVTFTGDVRLLFGKDVEIRTESLHYSISGQTGDSDDKLNFQSPQASGTARGVRYDNAHRRLELMHELSFVAHRDVLLPDGTRQVQDYQLSAQQGYYSEEENLFRLIHAARIDSSAGRLAADRIEAVLTPGNRRISSLSCQGNASYQYRDASEERTLQGERIDFQINELSRSIESIHVRENARFALKSESGVQDLAAAEILLELDPASGKPRMVRSQSGVQFEMVRESRKTSAAGEWLEALFLPDSGAMESMRVRDRAVVKLGGASPGDELRAEDIRFTFRSAGDRSVPRELHAEKSVQWLSAASSSSPSRSLETAALHMVYSESGDSLASGTAAGGVVISSLPAVGDRARPGETLQCDRARFDFFPGENQLQSLDGEGDVRIFYRRAGPTPGQSAEEYRTSSASFQARFRHSDGSVESMSQTGSFAYEDGSRTATAGRCDFNAESEVMILSDNPGIRDENSNTRGDIVEYDRKQKQLAVRGHVRSVLQSASGKSSGLITTAEDDSSPSIVTADQMLYWIDSRKVLYGGRVHLLSADSQVQADSLAIADQGGEIDAQGEVRHLIVRFDAGNTKLPSAKEKQGAVKAGGIRLQDGGPVLIRTQQMRFSRATNAIRYSGGVILDSSGTTMKADNMDVFLDAGGGTVERALARGNLNITQAGRLVKGREAEYFLAEGRFVVTGTPAELYDPVHKLKSNASRLTFFTADDRILAVR